MRHGLAGVRQARDSLPVPDHRHPQLDLVRLVSGEGRAELLVELLRKAARECPAEHGDAEVRGRGHGRLRGGDVVGMPRDARGVEHHESCAPARLAASVTSRTRAERLTRPSDPSGWSLSSAARMPSAEAASFSSMARSARRSPLIRAPSTPRPRQAQDRHLASGPDQRVEHRAQTEGLIVRVRHHGKCRRPCRRDDVGLGPGSTWTTMCDSFPAMFLVPAHELTGSTIPPGVYGPTAESPMGSAHPLVPGGAGREPGRGGAARASRRAEKGQR